MPGRLIPEHVDLLGNPTPVMKWLEEQDVGSQQSYATNIFDTILGEAAQPRSVSGNACVRLCGFVERVSKSESESLQLWAFSQDVTLRLYDFYIDWNEFDHHRSMRLVLDLIAQLLRRNPDKKAALEMRDSLLDNLVSIVIGRSTKPVAKSALKTLDYFLAKGVFNLDDVKATHLSYHQELSQAADVEIWNVLTVELLQWTRLHFICPAAGKFIVSLFRALRQRGHEDSTGLSIDTWHRWLLDFLAEEPSLLENFKNYIFLPLFKVDRPEGLKFLQKVNQHESSSAVTPVNEDFDASALLALAALETGKKVGLVEEPYLGSDQSNEDNSSITLRENTLASVLTHPSHEVRTSALSLLISSPSTTRPYSVTTLELLKRHLATFFADPDAKFRVDVCARVRDMFKRVRGAISILKKSIPRARAKARKNASKDAASGLSQQALYRTNIISWPESELVYCLEYHEKFLRWYLGFLCEELSPTTSYQRHITSLKSLISILRMEGDGSKTWETPEDQELFFDYFDGKWLRALADLVMDPFDDVRDTASLALTQLFADKRYKNFTLNSTATSQKPSRELEELLYRAEKVSIRTARADHSDGVARASQLLYKFLDTEDERLGLLSKLVDTLDQKISRAEADLGQAVLEQPLHSSFASLCFTWQAVSEKKLSKSEAESASALQDRMIECCERVWKAVRDVLCDDSPEGHLPEEMEDTEGLDTKGLLSYSFRAIHESSNLMRTIALSMRNRSREGLITPSRKAFETIGNLAFEQLANLRHRGAFTTVAATFATCCQLTKHLDLVEGETSLLNVWYKGTLNEIFTQRSTTRRSAGIPSMMTGVLSANASAPSFEDAMARLIEIASIEARVIETDGSNLPQVHAYNCLKDIFKNSLLTSMGNKSEKYLPQCLELAASGLRSEVWAIRNCGLIFLRSLIDSLFGSQESKAMIEAGWDGKANRIPYHRYPNLPTVLASLLKSGHKMVTSTNATSSAESVFPALDIIRRAGPPDLLRDEIQIHVAAYLSSPVWHVREIAARTLCSCLLHEKWLGVVQDLFHKSLTDKTVNGQNHVHGVLLSLKFLIERFSEVAPDRLTADLPKLTAFLETSHIDSVYVNCPDVIAAYLEVINLIWMSQISQSQPLQPPKVLLPTTNGSALLKAQSIISRILSLSQTQEPVEQVKALLCESRIGADTMVAALESIQKLWHSTSTADHIRIALCDLYIDVCLRTNFMEPQVVAIEYLVELINQLIAEDKLDSLPITSLMDMWTILPQHALNPSLSNAIVRASGCIVAAMSQDKRLSTPALRNWGVMIADAGSDDKSFDTRFAAAQSLCSFFSVTRSSCTSEEYLPVIIALYDAINDDDDEVREAGSTAARNILGQNLAPLEASARLLQWLAQHFGSSADFKAIVAGRVTGHRASIAGDQPWGSPGAQLDAALRSDDSLFAVEEQNLFIDEVREANRWAAVFQNLEWDDRRPEDGKVLDRLDAWICDGLAEMQLLVKQEDGPLGWASNPHVFAISTSILRGAVTLKRNHGTAKLRQAIDDVKALLKMPDHNRISKLLMEPLEEEQ
ncbi:putative death-receptor fusion protein domain-containing protein [Trichoderma chlorosporum]